MGCFLRSQKHVLPNTYYCNSLSRRLHKHTKKDHPPRENERDDEREEHHSAVVVLVLVLLLVFFFGP